MSRTAISLRDHAGGVALSELAECARSLDPATRALLALSVRRGVRDDQMAPILRTDPFHRAWRRARALETIASDLGSPGREAARGEARMALEALPREAWGQPAAGPSALPAREPAATTAALVPASAAPAGRLARLGALAPQFPTPPAALLAPAPAP